jgi:transposase-like protein
MKCPKCGKTNIEIKKRDVGSGNEMGMPSRPPEKPLKCKDCGHEFDQRRGEFFTKNTLKYF